MEIQARMLSREQIVRAALSHSFVLNVSSMSEALFFSNKYAPEHLIINAQVGNSQMWSSSWFCCTAVIQPKGRRPQRKPPNLRK